jgi:uncharacterized protein
MVPHGEFCPLSAAIGGALIGIATALLMITSGRIAGISGIVDGLIGSAADKGWRAAFVAGLILAPLAANLVGVTLSAPQCRLGPRRPVPRASGR